MAVFQGSVTQRDLKVAETYVLEHGLELDPGHWIFGSHIDHEGRAYAHLVEQYFQVPGKGQRGRKVRYA